ncbi:Asp-tRNA(Asn)/Glu-tRNA(Gln) amidotransferase subunit GatC [Holosporaceae bacterium 'Namur']|nr:Asp-tRNA(Asn)/Glu-tRNA(Gln) amidotransferase subunit GatC [Holosporaceae bacterium 'Namur']
MSIDSSVVKKIAHLARIRITDEEASGYEKELNSILNWVEQLNEAETEGVEPLRSVINAELPRRKDEVTEGGIQEAVLKNSPISKYGCFIVPKVVE